MLPIIFARLAERLQKMKSLKLLQHKKILDNSFKNNAKQEQVLQNLPMNAGMALLPQTIGSDKNQFRIYEKMIESLVFIMLKKYTFMVSCEFKIIFIKNFQLSPMFFLRSLILESAQFP